MNKHNKIKFVSISLRWIFTILAIILPITTLLAWLSFPEPFTSEFFSFRVVPDVPILNKVPTINILLAIVVSCIPLILSLLICVKLIKVFKSFEVGDFFNSNNILILKSIALVLFIKEVINPVTEAIISGLITMNNPPGKGLMVASMDQGNLLNILLAAIILLISWLLSEAYILKEEQAHTI